MKAQTSLRLHSLQYSSKVATWKLVITEELLEFPCMVPLLVNTFLCEVEGLLQKFELPLNELLCLVIHGVPLLSGCKNGVIGKLNTNVG
jgi:hypothetical protein